MANGNGAGSPLRDLIPQKAQVLVGDVELTLREPVLSRIDTAWRTVSDAELSEALEGLKKIWTSAVPEQDTGRATVTVEGPNADGKFLATVEEYPDVAVEGASENEARDRAGEAARAIWEAAKKDSKAQLGWDFLEKNFAALVSVVDKGLVPLVSRKLATVIAIALDQSKNRLDVARAMADERGEGEEEILKVAELSSASFQEWVLENLTARQAAHVLGEIVKIGGWADLGKRLWTLVAGSVRAQLQPAENLETPAS